MMSPRALILLGSLALVAACGEQVVDLEQAAAICEDRARAAQGPTGSVSVGANSRTGGSFGAAIQLSSDYLAGRDPVAVYESCYTSRTGLQPFRAPRLR